MHRGVHLPGWSCSLCRWSLPWWPALRTFGGLAVGASDDGQQRVRADRSASWGVGTTLYPYRVDRKQLGSTPIREAQWNAAISCLSLQRHPSSSLLAPATRRANRLTRRSFSSTGRAARRRNGRIASGASNRTAGRVIGYLRWTPRIHWRGAMIPSHRKVERARLSTRRSLPPKSRGCARSRVRSRSCWWDFPVGDTRFATTSETARESRPFRAQFSRGLQTTASGVPPNTCREASTTAPVLF